MYRNKSISARKVDEQRRVREVGEETRSRFISYYRIAAEIITLSYYFDKRFRFVHNW